VSKPPPFTLEEAQRRLRESIAKEPLAKKKASEKGTNVSLLAAEHDFVLAEINDGACTEDLARRFSYATGRNYTAESIEKNLRDLALKSGQQKRLNDKARSEAAKKQKSNGKAAPPMNGPSESKPSVKVAQPQVPSEKRSTDVSETDLNEAANIEKTSTYVSDAFGNTPGRF
jgi:hypothetical protein